MFLFGMAGEHHRHDLALSGGQAGETCCGRRPPGRKLGRIPRLFLRALVGGQKLFRPDRFLDEIRINGARDNGDARAEE